MAKQSHTVMSAVGEMLVRVINIDNIHVEVPVATLNRVQYKYDENFRILPNNEVVAFDEKNHYIRRIDWKKTSNWNAARDIRMQILVALKLWVTKVDIRRLKLEAEIQYKQSGISSLTSQIDTKKKELDQLVEQFNLLCQQVKDLEVTLAAHIPN